jgi:hypothetical protein
MDVTLKNNEARDHHKSRYNEEFGYTSVPTLRHLPGACGLALAVGWSFYFFIFLLLLLLLLLLLSLLVP